MNKTYLVHSGIKGQRWGVRRYQNEDGSLTPAGIRRYGTSENMNRARSRNKKIAIGVGVAAVAAGGVALAVKNRRLKNKYGVLKKSDDARLAKNSAARAKRAANKIQRAKDIASGKIKPTQKIFIKAGSDVLITKGQGPNKQVTNNLLNVIGGVVKIKTKGGK